MEKHHTWESKSTDLNWKLHKQEHFWLLPELHPVQKKKCAQNCIKKLEVLTE